MKRLICFFPLFLLLSACVIVVDGPCAGLKEKRFNIEEESKFLVKKPLTLRINTKGFIDTVVVSPSKDKTLLIKTEVKATVSTNIDDVRVKVEEKNGTIYVRTVLKPENRGVSICNLKGVSRIMVFVPDNVKHIVFNTSSTDFKCSGVKIDLMNINTSSGDVAVANSKFSEMEIDTSSGDISLKNVKVSDFRIDSSSGDLAVSDCTFENFHGNFSSGDITGGFPVSIGKGKVSTSSGDVVLKLKKFRKLRINTSSGDVKLVLIHPEKIYLYAETNSGDFNIRIPLPDGVKVKNNVLEFGESGMPELNISTSSGDISLSNM